MSAFDVPAELRPLEKLFAQVAYRHGSYSTIYSDFLDYAVGCFLVTGDVETAERLQKVYGKDYLVFNQMFQTWLQIQEQQIVGDKDWYDALGTYYESITSRWKSSSMGQFFTPPEICKLMVYMQCDPEIITGKGESVNDPCSGSGRMLVAWHAAAPGNYQFGADIDPMCAKMTALNMCIHGCQGEAVCMDTLKNEYRFGYLVNADLRRFGVPTLRHLKEENCRQVLRVPAESESSPKPGKKGQYSLF